MRDEQAFEIDLIQVIKFVWLKKIIVSAITVVFIGIAIGASYLITPIFQAEAVLAPINSDVSGKGMANQLGGLADIVGINAGGNADESTVHMATFVSRKFMREFIEENKLKKILYAEMWDNEKLVWKEEEPTLWDTVNKFENNVRTITTNQETGLVTLQVNWEDPELAVNWADLMIIKINKVLHEEFIQETRQNLDYLNEQLLKTQNSEMRSVLFSLIQEQVKKEMLSSNNKNFAYKVVDPPVIPEKKLSPQRSLFAIAGMLLGGIVGVIYAWIEGNKMTNNRRENTL